MENEKHLLHRYRHVAQRLFVFFGIGPFVSYAAEALQPVPVLAEALTADAANRAMHCFGFGG